MVFTACGPKNKITREKEMGIAIQRNQGDD